MKKLIISLLLTVPMFASHSVDMGIFYTQHNETHYKYDFYGVQASYEIGNSKGLKAVGKVQLSTDSDLLYIASRNDLIYYIPYENFEISPFFGAHATRHNVYKSGPTKGILTRVYIPIGMGIDSTWEKFNWEIRAAHLIPTGHYFLQIGKREIFGRKYGLDSSYFVEWKLGYAILEKVRIQVLANFTQDYGNRLTQWTCETFATIRF